MRDQQLRRLPPIAWLFLAILFLAAFQNAAFASETEPVSPRNLNLLVYSGDNSESATIEDVCCNSTNADWTPAKGAQTSFASPIAWVKLPSLGGGLVIEFPQMVDVVTLYERQSPDDPWTTQSTGDTLPVSQRPMHVAEMAITLSDFDPSRAERYVRIEQPSSISHAIDTWEPAAFEQSIASRFLVQTLLFGFCAAMVTFNVLVSIVTRESIFAFNAATITSTILIAVYLTGQGGFYLWPETPEVSYIILVLAMGGLSLFATQFISGFLAGSSVNPALLRFNRWFGAGQFVTAVVILITGSHALYAALMLVGVASMAFQLFLIFFSIFKGDRQSLPILIPLCILIAGIMLRWARTAFSVDFGWANYHIMEIALALEAITFSLVLAARIRFLDKKANSVQAQLDQVRIDSANRFARLQDNLRAKFSSDLHDSLGHTLANTKERLGKLMMLPAGSEEFADHLSLCDRDLRNAISDTRRISHDLHPAKLDHLGLKRCIEAIFRDLQSLHKKQYDLKLDFAEDALSYDQKIQILRIVQEAVSNVIKHSDASHCSLAMSVEGDTLTFDLSDDGIGLDESKVAKPDGAREDAGIGLFSMRQRAAMIGAHLQVAPNAPKGTRLTMQIPLRHGQAAGVQ